MPSTPNTTWHLAAHSDCVVGAYWLGPGSQKAEKFWIFKSSVSRRYRV